MKPAPEGRFRVIELGSWLAAPGATALLGDIGAEVIKVEAPTGDPGRQFLQAMGSEAATSPSFALLNRGKKSVVLDIASADGRAKLEQLIGTADVFVTNLRIGSLRRLDLLPETMLRRYPRLIYASITGLGLRGPECDKATYDVGGFWARTGLMHQIVPPEGTPPSPTGGFGDFITSLSMYAGIVTALFERERTGLGGLVETSLLQTGAFVAAGDLAVQAAHGHVAGQRPRVNSRNPMVNSYRCRKGLWFFLTGFEAARHFPALCRAIGRADLIDDPRFSSAANVRKNGQALVGILDEAFEMHPLDEWAKRFEKEDVWWQPIATPAEVLSYPQLVANDMLRPVWSESAYHPMVTSPFNMSRRSLGATRAPDIGEDSRVLEPEMP